MTAPTQVSLPLKTAPRGPGPGHKAPGGPAAFHADAARRALAEARPACFWLDRALRPEALEALQGDTEADLAIVGGGFTGLWAALLALEENPGRDVLLLEASRIGEGASGRNGGFADPSLTHGVLNGLEHFPEEIETLEGLGRSNFAELLAALERHGIDARYEASGKLEVAVGEAWLPELREYQETLQRFGESSEWLDRDAVRGEVHSPTYEGGVFHPGGGGVLDPARLCWGLAATVRGLGARIHEGTPVTKLRSEGERVALATPGGRVRARKVLFATNAFRAPLFRMRRAVIPVWDYVLMSEPLGTEQRRAIGWERRQGIGDTTNQFHYYRLTDDDRILWGGYDAIYYYGSSTESRRQQYAPTFEKLAEHFFETFPQLEGLRFSHSWGGPIGTTTRFCLDSGSAMGGRVSWSIGYTGMGVGASRFGARIALQRLDHPDDPLLRVRLARSRAFPWPPEPLRWLVVQLTRHELARADRNGGRRGPWLRLLDALGLGFDS